MADVCRCSTSTDSTRRARTLDRRSAHDAVPEVGRMLDVADVEALQRHGRSARMVEEAGAVAEQDRRDQREHLVELTGLQALPGDVGAEDVDVGLVPGRVLGGGDRLAEA